MCDAEMRVRYAMYINKNIKSTEKKDKDTQQH